MTTAGMMSAPSGNSWLPTDTTRNIAGESEVRRLQSERDRPNLFLMTNTLEIGGSERQFAALAGAIHPERFQIHLGCLRRYGPLVKKIGNITEFPLHGSFFTWQAWRSRLDLGRFLRAKHIAVAHAFDFYTNLMLLPVARLAGIPVVIGSHRQLGDLLSPAQFRAQAAAFRFCDRIVCNSRAAALRLTQHGVPTHKLVVIPNGLAPEAFATATPILQRSPGIVRIGMIARMNVRYKNQAGFLRAAARVCETFKQAEFVLAGDGVFRPEFERMARGMGLASRVRFLGECDDIPAVLAALDITVVPSVSESFPNVILESMAAGVPVVATRVGGIPDAVEDEKTGLLVPPEDDERMAEAISRLIRQASLREEIGRRARDYAAGHFQWDSVSEQYEGLYVKLLAKKDRRWRAQFLPAENGQNKKLRIAVVGPSLRQLGGQSVQVDLLLRQWCADVEVDASFVPIDPDWPNGWGWLGRIPYIRTMARELLYGRILWRKLRRADIAHVFVASYASFLVVLLPPWLFGRARGTKLLVHCHSGEAQDHLGGSRMARYLLRKAETVAVPSGYLVDVLRQFGVEAKVVPNIVNLDQFSYRRRDTFEPSFVCTRGFHAYYRIDDVLRAFAEIQRKFPSARLCLVGGGQSGPEMKRLARDLGLMKVEFSGLVSREQIGQYYERANFFLNASVLDNMPVSILEAFASGTPVITTASGGIPHIVEHERTGLLCEPGDWKSLAENALRIVREPELARRIAANAYEESKRYQWENVRPQWLALYRNVLREENPLATREDLQAENRASKGT